MTSTTCNLWSNRVRTPEKFPRRSSHPGIFCTSRGAPQASPRLSVRGCYADARSTPPPPSIPSTEPGSSSPEGSLRQVSPESDNFSSENSADESDSLSPPVPEHTPQKSGASLPTLQTDNISEEEIASPASAACTAAGRARGLDGGPNTELRDLESEMAELTHDFVCTDWVSQTAPPCGSASCASKASAAGPCARGLNDGLSSELRDLESEKAELTGELGGPDWERHAASRYGTPQRFVYKYVRGGISFPPQMNTASCVSSARAAAAHAKDLNGALSTELRELEGEMSELTHDLLAIRAALPDGVSGELRKTDAEI